MRETADCAWNGERNRPLSAYRACPCAVCSKGRRGVGYLSFSNAKGRGFTIWMRNEMVFRGLRQAVARLSKDHPVKRLPPGGNRLVAPPKPDRAQLLKQVRRATIEDQMHLLDWLEKKYGKVKPPAEQ